ncbi:MAG: SBBP repeat-containing protein [Acidobacteria bacterium]|nr:SBBP repeat-containing protein [Acidobacteriota bacterium]
MKTRVLCFCCLLPLLTGAHGQTVAPPAHSGMPAQKVRVAEGYGKLPLAFEANQGQSDPQVKFLTRGAGYSLFLTSTEAVLTLRKASQQKPVSPTAKSLPPLEQSAVLHMKLAGANSKTEMSGQDELPGKSNYFVGDDPKKWQANVRQYAKVRYENVYPGVDLVYYGNQRELEYDFVLQPGIDPSVIRLGIEGATKLRLEQGDLVLSSAAGNVHLRRPQIYQQVNGARREIRGGYVINKNEVGFRVGSYDHQRQLIIDPVLAYSTYLGGSGRDFGTGIAVDLAGNAYVTGYTYSTDFPTANVIQATNHGSADAYVTKINADGSALVYSTYLGGSRDDFGWGVAVDAAGNAYLTGYTRSTDFPAANPIQRKDGSGYNAFVTKINRDGNALVYSTYLGGGGDDFGHGIAVDAAGNAYVTGWTYSTDFPTTNSFQTGNHGSADAYVTKINADGSDLVYSTYLGGSSHDYGSAIAVDAAGNYYVIGTTCSTDFPTANPIQATNHGCYDAFITKINADGSTLSYSTYLGGSGEELGQAIAVDGTGNAYFTGYTRSTNFPTVRAIQSTNHGEYEVFVSKINSDGSALVYSTYLGGADWDFGSGIAADAAGNAYVTGYTYSTDFPTANALRAENSGFDDAFVAMVNAAGSGLVYSTYLGGKGYDYGQSIAVDAIGNAYVSGSAQAHHSFPTTLLAFQPSSSGRAAFITKIASQTFVSVSPLKLTFGKAVVGTSSKPKKVTLTNTGTGVLAINQIYIAGKDTGDFTQTSDCEASIEPTASCTISIIFTPTAVGKRIAVLVISDSDPASPQAVALSGNGIVGLNP